MELFFIILIFIVTMIICYIIGEGLDTRFKDNRPKIKDNERIFYDEFDYYEPIEDDDIDDAEVDEEINEEKEEEPDKPQTCTETGGLGESENDEVTDQNNADGDADDADEDDDDVIRGCVGEIVESPDEMISRITGYARECAENIAKALGGNVIDLGTYVVDDKEVKKQK